MKPNAFHYNPAFEYTSGWDKYALSYAELLKPNTIYSLTKELAHSVIKHYLEDGKDKRVLDLNCGTGNDFPFFLNEGYQVAGTDGSYGMLNKAFEIYAKEINEGKIELFQLMMEDLSERSFQENSFDLIYSITGGYSYINDNKYLSVNRVLVNYLKPGGYLITAHLTPFCLGETWHWLKRFKPGQALKRLKTTLDVPIKGEKHKMYLRSVYRLRKLKTQGLNLLSTHPIITTTPPYQTNYQPDLEYFKILSEKEHSRVFDPKYNLMADQVMLVEQKEKP